MKRIGVLGSIAMDNIFEAEAVPRKGQRVYGRLLGSFVGGIGANQAREAARYGGEVYLLGQIGRDATGDHILENLAACGVRLERVARADSRTGQTYMYLVDGKNDYFSVVTPGANGDIDPSLAAGWLEGLDMLLVSLEICPEAALAVLNEAHRQGLEIWLSPSPAECCTEEMISLAHGIILNRREGERLLGLSGEDPARLADQLKAMTRGPEIILLSMGEQGALLKYGDVVYQAPALQVPVVDTVGAGDALAGTIIASLAKGLPPYQALCYGCIAGGLAVSTLGAQSSPHDGETLRDLYQQYYETREVKTL